MVDAPTDGIAQGGSLIFSASMLTLLDDCDAAEQGNTLDPKHPDRQVIGLDIDIRAHNRAAIEAHPMANRIQLIQGSSIDPEIIARVHAMVVITSASWSGPDHCYGHLAADNRIGFK